MRYLANCGAAALLLYLGALPAAAQTCGKNEAIAEGETLEQLAARCDTEVEAILSANPSLERTDIRAGLQLEMPAASGEEDWLDRARNAVRDAGERVHGAAEATGKSVSEYLSEQPDLNRDILEFGERLGLPGVSAGASGEAELTVVPKSAGPGENVTLVAQGLPGDAEVSIDARIGDGSDFQNISRARTDAAGRLQATVAVPAGAREGQEIVFAVETTDGRMRLVSDVFDLGS
ncbi:Gamma-D-glutamyl-L-diamino acid endopeptidase I (plasmid) [Sinorhizobium sojae CCBAU 05684]|uniref:Gamma-D-glutamyl-L-diamino acid endopeptidase I n=1 Tax=Sinorhizobium sojae CCBAU 05684 TaxID=716928 RepID=A0A249PIE4_9HYPH|nr:LysM domain-containing protein [Sinorhizobium sojae]ASY65517.1 Gamma-D-glutamyl-L-diamino acid endopeptidase I [Sinorhizobium sojae CCBAU 05684]